MIKRLEGIKQNKESNRESLVGRAGLEPATFCASGTPEPRFGQPSPNWEDFEKWAKKKYSKTWAPTLIGYAKKYHEMLNGSLRELDSFSKSKRANVMKSLIALSKYLGVYEQFKAKMTNYGFKWESQNSLESFLRIMNTKEGIIDRAKACMKVLDESQATFIRFTALSGLRKGEALDSFNMIIKLSQEGKLNEYYNSELESLEHFRFESTFIRGSKNVFFTFMPKALIEQIATCNPISNMALESWLKRRGMRIRMNELRDHYATFMVHNGLIREEIDILQGRVGKSIFMRHYFSPAIKELRDRTLRAVNEMMRVIS